MGDGVYPIDDIVASAAQWRREHEEHCASCTAEICPRCARYGCRDCSRRVESNGDRCLRCLVRQHRDSIRIPRRYDDLGLWPRVRPLVDARVRSAAAITVAESIAKDIATTPTVALVGPAGAGKSTLLAAMGTQRLVEGLRTSQTPAAIRWTSEIALGLARSQHRLGSGEEAELIYDASTASLLLLDDLGAGTSPRDIDVIAQVIHARYDEALPTWYSTGITADAIASRYGGGVHRRLIEGAVIIDCAARGS